MSQKCLCDRCGRDVTDKVSGVVIAAKDGGEYQFEVDTCPRCHREFVAWFTKWLKNGRP